MYAQFLIERCSIPSDMVRWHDGMTELTFWHCGSVSFGFWTADHFDYSCVHILHSHSKCRNLSSKTDMKKKTLSYCLILFQFPLLKRNYISIEPPKIVYQRMTLKSNIRCDCFKAHTEYWLVFTHDAWIKQRQFRLAVTFEVINRTNIDRNIFSGYLLLYC